MTHDECIRGLYKSMSKDDEVLDALGKVDHACYLSDDNGLRQSHCTKLASKQGCHVQPITSLVSHTFSPLLGKFRLPILPKYPQHRHTLD